MTASTERAFAPYARILGSEAYRPLWLGQVGSNFGDTLHYVALVVLLFRLTGSGAVLAALSLAQIVAGLMLGPYAGVLVDRLDRRRLMVVVDFARAGLAAALAFTTTTPLAFGLAVGLTAVGVPFRPTLQSLLPSLVAEDDLLAANSVGWSTEQGTQIVAAALAGGLLLAWGTRPAFLLNAASCGLLLVAAGDRGRRAGRSLPFAAPLGRGPTPGILALRLARPR